MPLASRQIPGAVPHRRAQRPDHLPTRHTAPARLEPPPRSDGRSVPYFDCASFDQSDRHKRPLLMQLWERGKFRMADPVAKVHSRSLPQNGKQDITIRQLLVHYSGLAPRSWI